MGVTTTKTNKPLNPRGNDQSPKGFNRAKLFSGKALSFDGVNDYVDLAGFTMSGTNASFVFNLKADAWGSLEYIFDLSPKRLVFGSNTGNDISIYDSVSWKKFADFSDTINRNNFVLTIEGTTAKLYLNGQSFGDTLTLSTTIDLSATTELGLMSARNFTGNFFNGQIAGFKIFNTALTAAQVADLYNNPEKVVPTGVDNTALKLWLPMMEGAGTTAYDGSGNGNHGTISGATYVNGVGAPVAQSAVMDWNKGTNILYYSESFDNAAWIKSGTAVVTPNTTIAPNGLQTADTLTLSGSGYVGRTRTTNVTATFSVFAKYSDTPWLFIEGYDGADKGAWFNIQTGTLGSTSGGATATIKEAANGFYRCSITAAISGSNTYAIFQATGNGSFTRATGDVIIWGAQVEESATLGAYIPNPTGSELTSDVLLPQGLTSGRDITGVNLFENVRKQGALNLDGNSWAEVHDNGSLDVTTGLTLEAWVYSSASDATAGDGVLSKWHEGSNERSYLMYALDFDSFYFFVSNDGTASNSVTFGINSADYEKYNHFVCTFDGTNLKAYVNGALYNTSAATFSSIYNSDKNVAIGNYNIGQTPERKYNNSIAQPRIYNRALTAEEVQRNYNAGKNIYTN